MGGGRLPDSGVGLRGNGLMLLHNPKYDVGTADHSPLGGGGLLWSRLLRRFRRWYAGGLLPFLRYNRYLSNLLYEGSAFIILDDLDRLSACESVSGRVEEG